MNHAAFKCTRRLIPSRARCHESLVGQWARFDVREFYRINLRPPRGHDTQKTLALCTTSRRTVSPALAPRSVDPRARRVVAHTDPARCRTRCRTWDTVELAKALRGTGVRYLAVFVGIVRRENRARERHVNRTAQHTNRKRHSRFRRMPDVIDQTAPLRCNWRENRLAITHRFRCRIRMPEWQCKSHTSIADQCDGGRNGTARRTTLRTAFRPLKIKKTAFLKGGFFIAAT